MGKPSHPPRVGEDLRSMDEWCARCGGTWPGYGPKASTCGSCGAMFCGACLKVHAAIVHQDKTWAQTRPAHKRD